MSERRASHGRNELRLNKREHVHVGVPHGWAFETAFARDGESDKVEETLDLHASDHQAMRYVRSAAIPPVLHVLRRDDAEVEKNYLNLADQTLRGQRQGDRIAAFDRTVRVVEAP